MSLRDELERLASSAPVADVPADTWRRARRARTRDLSLLAAAAVAVVAVLALAAGLVGWGSPPRELQPAGGDDQTLGVPSRVWSVSSDAALDLETDLAIGPAAVATVSTEMQPVVVGADGDYHLLDLPGYHGDSIIVPRRLGLSLSPDGLALSWGWTDGDDARARSGVRVADLVSGEVRTVDLGRGVVAQSFTWSPDGSWLVWSGVAAGGRYGLGHGPQVAGRIAAGATTSDPLPAGADASTLYAIDDEGVVLIATQRVATTWDGAPTGRTTRPGGQYPDVATPNDGVVLESVEGMGGFRYRRLVDNAVTEPRIPGLAHGTLAPYGWLDDTTVVAARYDNHDDSNHLVLVDLSDPTEASVRVVGDLDMTPAAVAVDLMTHEQPTIDRGEPDWLPWSAAFRSLVIGLSVVAIWSAWLTLRWFWRRLRTAGAARSPASFT